VNEPRQRMLEDEGARAAMIGFGGLAGTALGWLISQHPFSPWVVLFAFWGLALGFFITLIPESWEDYRKRLAQEAETRRTEEDRDQNHAQHLAVREQERAKADLKRALLDQATIWVMERNLPNHIRDELEGRDKNRSRWGAPVR
jgi:hypothetical protein